MEITGSLSICLCKPSVVVTFIVHSKCFVILVQSDLPTTGEQSSTKLGLTAYTRGELSLLTRNDNDTTDSGNLINVYADIEGEWSFIFMKLLVY